MELVDNVKIVYFVITGEFGLAPVWASPREQTPIWQAKCLFKTILQVIN